MKERKAFRNLNLSVFLHFVGRQAYSIFVPVILLKNGYSLGLVLLFLIFSSSITIVSSYIGQRVMAGKNVIYFNILAVISEVCLLLLMVKTGFALWVFLLIVLFEGFYYAFYYLSYFAITVHYTSQERTGTNLGNLTIAVAFASIIGPLLGSYILTGSKIYLIITAIATLLVSLIPLTRIAKPDVEGLNSGKIDFREIKKYIFNYGVMASFEVVIFVLWGVYAYISNFTLLNIGLIAVATSVARITLSHIIKEKLVEKNFRKKVMALSVLGVILVSIYRFYIPSHIVITNFLMAFFYVGYQLGAQTAIINQFKGNRTYYSSMLLQVTSFSIRIPVYLLAFVIGLRSIILLPVAVGTAYLLLNFPSSLIPRTEFKSLRSN